MNQPRREPNGGIPRRQLLRVGGAGVLAAASLAGCDLLSTEPGGSEGGDGRANTDAKEAPMLAERVKSGDLPPLEQRLPDNPVVVEPNEQVGTYGGEWHSALLGPADGAWLHRTIGYEQLMRWDVEWTEPLLNLAESIEPNEDGTVFTVKLRAGIKWSDGEPYTVDDLLFWYEDVLANTDMHLQSTPSFMDIGDAPPTYEKIDDHTLTMTFSTPNGMLIENLPTPGGETMAGRPRHYLEPFHADYSDNIDQVVEEEGAAGWVELIDTKAGEGRWENKDIPTLNPWILTAAFGDGSRVVAERNPYYWKVDPDGRQLPYIDKVIYNVIEDEEVILINATNGELDMHQRHIVNLQNKPVLAKSRESGDYEFGEIIGSSMNHVVIALNLTHKDPVKREIFQNLDFRIGLSHAINRQEIIDAVFQQQGEPWQCAPRQESEFYDEEMAKQYTEYDVDLANQHLDQAGYTERDGDDFRLGPDGKRIQFNVEVSTGLNPFWPDALELVRGYWREVGIDMQVTAEDRSLMYERKEANEHDANVWGGDAGMKDAILDPRWFMPFSTESNYATPWANWFTDSQEFEQEEPPAAPKKQMELYNQIRAALDPEERNELFREILQIGKEQFYAIGLVLPVGGYNIIKNTFHNVPKSMPDAWQYPGPGPSNPEQYYIDA